MHLHFWAKQNANIQKPKNALIDNAISHFTTKGFGFVSVASSTEQQRKTKRRRYDFRFSFNFIVQLIAVRLCRVKPLGCCIKMNFIASIKGHNDDPLKI